MATVKKGTVSPANSWARHLRAYGKRLFWKKQRQAVKNIVNGLKFQR